MTSFEAIYRANCKLRGEQPDQVATYQNLDKVWSLVESRPEMKAALNEQRLCIVVPAPCAPDAPKYFYDLLSEDRQPMYYFDPLTDRFRVEILNGLAEQETSPAVLAYYGGKQGFLLWKLRRLEKRNRLVTWKAYAENYS